jgi:hypothetical protein
MMRAPPSFDKNSDEATREQFASLWEWGNFVAAARQQQPRQVGGRGLWRLFVMGVLYKINLETARQLATVEPRVDSQRSTT